MLCLFLMFRKLKSACLLAYPSVRRISRTSLCENSVQLFCGFAQISLILLSILLKLDSMQTWQVGCAVLVLALVGGGYNNILRNFMYLI